MTYSGGQVWSACMRLLRRLLGENGKLEAFRKQLGREMLKKPCKPHLRQIVVRILGHEG